MKQTVGKIATELQQKEPESRDPIELQRSMQEDYFKNLTQCIDVHKKSLDGPFFVVVITKNERLLPNVFRNYFTARKSCPTPDYDQTVFRFDDYDVIEYLWTIPSRQASLHLKEHALEVSKEEHQLLQHVLDFADGTLFKLAKKYNGEKEDSPLLEEM